MKNIKEAAGVVEKMTRVNYYPVVAGSLVGQRCMDANGEMMFMFYTFDVSLFGTYLSQSFEIKQTSNCCRSICNHRCIDRTVTDARDDLLWFKQSSSSCKN